VRQFIKKILLFIIPSVIKHRTFVQYKQLSWKSLSVVEFDAELLLLEFLLKKDSVFFDVGGNKGEYTYYAEKIISPSNSFVFEPEKKLHFTLTKLFKNCQVYDIAFSDSKGIQQFKTPIINGVADNCLSTLEIGNKEDNETETIIDTVKTDTIDNFILEKNSVPNLIKIDVEGHELAVLKGAEECIRKHNPTLIIEIEQRHHQNTQIQAVFDDFKNKGYNSYYYSKKIGALLSFEDKQHLTNSKAYFGTVDYINNYIFIHSSNTTIQSIDAINKSIALKINA
jgi:FkbM family methyltransferase